MRCYLGLLTTHYMFILFIKLRIIIKESKELERSCPCPPGPLARFSTRWAHQSRGRQREGWPRYRVCADVNIFDVFSHICTYKDFERLPFPHKYNVVRSKPGIHRPPTDHQLP